jgi:hypothetical protein
MKVSKNNLKKSFMKKTPGARASGELQAGIHHLHRRK